MSGNGTVALQSAEWMPSCTDALVWTQAGSGANIVVMTDNEIAVGLLPKSKLKAVKEQLEMGEPLINVIGPKSTIVHFQTVQSITAELNGTDIAVVYKLAGGRRETCRLRMPDSEACHLYTSSRLNCETLRGFGTRFAPAGLSEIGLPIMQGANQCATESPWNFKELIWETSV